MTIDNKVAGERIIRQTGILALAVAGVVAVAASMYNERTIAFRNFQYDYSFCQRVLSGADSSLERDYLAGTVITPHSNQACVDVIKQYE